MAYQDDVAVSEGARQVTKAANNTTAGHKAADITHYTNLVVASRKWGVRNGAMAALLALGGSPPGQSFQQGDF
jgi:hypothetical protein